jgi:hypothetical protein
MLAKLTVNSLEDLLPLASTWGDQYLTIREAF